MPEFENDRLRRNYSLVIEGQCPNGHGELERRPECGWCAECGMGWSIRGNAVTAHFDVEESTTQLTGGGMLRSGPGRARLRFTPRPVSGDPQ